MRATIKGKLLTIQNSQYQTFVFQNLDEPEDSWDRYMMVTLCPNWNLMAIPSVGDKGYLEFEYVNAGESYVDSITGKTEQYKYSNYYLINFIKENNEIKNTEYEF